MDDFVNSDDDAQYGAIVPPGHDLGLDYMSTSFPHYQVNTSTVIPINHSTGRASMNMYSNDALTVQYNYPPPSVADNYQQYPYPDPSARTSEQIAACSAPSNVHMNNFRTEPHRYTDNLTVAPSQTLWYEQEDTYTDTSNTSGIVGAIDEGPQMAASNQPETFFTYQDHAHIQLMAALRTEDPSNVADFRDNSSPYVAGYVAGREVHLQRMTQHATEVLEAPVEQPSFECDVCPKKCKDRSSLSHHKRIHDPTTAHRHKCEECTSKGFQHPKDLERHITSKHRNVWLFSCADCNKKYKRKDHLQRHTKSGCNKKYKRKDHKNRHTKKKGHVVALGTASSPSASPSSTAPSTITSNRSAISPADSLTTDRSYNLIAQLSSPGERSVSNPDLSFLRAPLISSSSSFATRSVDETSTVSEVDSFCSE